MTTEIESLEAVHLWIAERLPQLRATITHVTDESISVSFPDGTMGGMTIGDNPVDIARGWVPNVTTDGLLQILEGDYHVHFGQYGHVYLREFGRSVAAAEASGTTPHEALARAAKLALIH